MLSNAYFLAKIRFDTAENEPAKNLQKLQKTKKGILKIAKFANYANPSEQADSLARYLPALKHAVKSFGAPEAR